MEFSNMSGNDFSLRAIASLSSLREPVTDKFKYLKKQKRIIRLFIKLMHNLLCCTTWYGTANSFNDVDKKIEDVGKFLQEELVKYCKQENTETTVKYFDPLYMLRAVRANAYDTKLCRYTKNLAI